MISILRVLGLVIIDPHLLQNTNKLLIYIQFIHSVSGSEAIDFKEKEVKRHQKKTIQPIDFNQ
jgi:hypothetical protein